MSDQRTTRRSCFYPAPEQQEEGGVKPRARPLRDLLALALMSDNNVAFAAHIKAFPPFPLGLSVQEMKMESAAVAAP